MSEKGKDILTALLVTVPKLDENKQNYLLGLADGMAMARENADQAASDKQLVEA